MRAIESLGAGVLGGLITYGSSLLLPLMGFLFPPVAIFIMVGLVAMLCAATYYTYSAPTRTPAHEPEDGDHGFSPPPLDGRSATAKPPATFNATITPEEEEVARIMARPLANEPPAKPRMASTILYPNIKKRIVTQPGEVTAPTATLLSPTIRSGRSSAFTVTKR